ncbi:MAG: hypothetical protein HXY18_13255 [Bryobacteraceae bacterium]|nr:hypothetical protein [Bryobacteraceae bacterium]
MEYLKRAGQPSAAAALLPSAWNPPTKAHVALAEAALGHAGEVVFVLPRAFPHKQFDGPPAETRMRWLVKLCGLSPRFSAAVSDGGLFVEMAGEARALGAERVLIVCGSDAAERIAGWPYPQGLELERQLETGYELLVAPRCAEWLPPARLAHRVHRLPLDGEIQVLSSTQVRELIRSGGDWRSLVPEVLADEIGSAYGRS